MTFIVLNTRDALDPSNPSNAVFNTRNLFRDFRYSRIDLVNITFQNLVYPINSNYNTLVFEEDGSGTDIVSTLTPGNYTASQLATEIKTQLDADGSNVYTVTYDANTFKYTISTDGTSLRITSDSTCLHIIGIADTGMGSFAASKVGDYPIRLDGTQYIDLISNLNSNNISSNDHPIFRRIPMSAEVGALFSYENAIDLSQPFNSETFTSIEIRLRDDRENLYDLPANCNVNYTFRLS